MKGLIQYALIVCAIISRLHIYNLSNAHRIVSSIASLNCLLQQSGCIGVDDDCSPSLLVEDFCSNIHWIKSKLPRLFDYVRETRIGHVVLPDSHVDEFRANKWSDIHVWVNLTIKVDNPYF